MLFGQQNGHLCALPFYVEVIDRSTAPIGLTEARVLSNLAGERPARAGSSGLLLAPVFLVSGLLGGVVGVKVDIAPIREFRSVVVLDFHNSFGHLALLGECPIHTSIIALRYTYTKGNRMSKSYIKEG